MNFFEELKIASLQEGFSEKLKQYDVPENEIGITVEQFLNINMKTKEQLLLKAERLETELDIVRRELKSLIHEEDIEYLKNKYEGKYFKDDNYYYHIVEITSQDRCDYIYLASLKSFESVIKISGSGFINLANITEITKEEFTKTFRNIVNNLLSDLNEQL